MANPAATARRPGDIVRWDLQIAADANSPLSWVSSHNTREEAEAEYDRQDRRDPTIAAIAIVARRVDGQWWYARLAKSEAWMRTQEPLDI